MTTNPQNKNDGGRAFPSQGGDSSGLLPNTGLTVRQYYKAAALQGLVSNTDILANACTVSENECVNTLDFIAKVCSEYADAMLREDEEFEATSKSIGKTT